MIVTDRDLRRRLGAVAAAAMATMLTSCSNIDGGGALGVGNNAQDSEDAVSVDRRREIIGRQERTPAPTPAPNSKQDPKKAKGDLEAPSALLTAVKDDLARRLLVKSDTIAVVSAVQVTWPDGGMGCGRPGEAYTQATIQGYKIILSASGKEYPYHSDLRGRFILCESGGSVVPVREQLQGPAPAQ